MGIQIVGHTSFLGHTGYNYHSRNFFTHLSRFLPVRIRNFTYVDDLTYLTEEEKNLIIEQTWEVPPYKVGKPFHRNPNDLLVNIVLNETNHYFFYDPYDHPKIAYNVWESTRQPKQFFDKILEYDQFWCPTEWQRQCTIEQGYPENRVKIVPEAVDPIFRPSLDQKKELDELLDKYNFPKNKIYFLVLGRWDYRKSITEIFLAFQEEFKDNDDVMMVAFSDNPFPVDGLKTTEDRIKFYGIDNNKIKFLPFVDRTELAKWLRSVHVYVSCSRSEGWNLPLIEAIASGTPSICSGWGAQLEFAEGISELVNIVKLEKPKNVFNINETEDLGYWCEPDFDHLRKIMKDVVSNWSTSYKDRAVKLSKYVRSLYTWDNAARIAKEHISKLTQEYYIVPESISIPDEEKIKINLGCGNDIRAGYINIDKFNNTKNVDLNCDLFSLPFKNNSVDEIFLAHVFEHIGINDVYKALDEWRRILKPTGELIIYVPNLERDINDWINMDDENKWLHLHKIYGSQSHEGNSHLSGYSIGSLKFLLESCDFDVKSIKEGNRGFGPEIQSISIKRPLLVKHPVKYNCHFVDGPFLEVLGDNSIRNFFVIDFLDPDNNASVHQHLARVNTWTRPFRKYYTNWLVTVKRNGKEDFKHNFDLAHKNVLISFDSKGIGDTLAWIPYLEEFRKKHNCTLFVSTFWNKLFKDHETYKKIFFINPGTVVNNLYASYAIGCFDDDFNKNKNNWRTIPLQKVASDFLGLEYKEIIADINCPDLKRPIEEKYVCISEHSTFQSKYWNYPGGWQQIVDYLNELGYKVVVVSKEATTLQNIIDRTNRPIEDTINTINHCELLLGVSSGPAWLAWALRIPVVLISGYSKEFAEFSLNVERVINKKVCHGCFNDTSLKFDRGDWNWCPKYKDTERQFECTKTITPDMVKKSINNILEKKNAS